jgi:elongation factor Ts
VIEMVDISASMVKELREKSGAAMMDCKKALVEAEGDVEKAFEVLRQRGVAVANKKSGRTASEGLVVGQISTDGMTGALLEINCETDFVARNDQFIELTKTATELVLKNKPADVETFLEQSTGDKKVKDLVTEVVAKIGENIIIRRLAVLEAKGDGIVGLYVHALGGKMGAILELSSSKPADREKLAAIAREIAMHVVSAKPQFISKDEIPADVIENERRIELGKADLAEKKPEMREKIVTGRVDKLMNERSLNEQMFVKDPNNSVGKYLATKGTELGTELKAVKFALFILGEQAAETNGKEE